MFFVILAILVCEKYEVSLILTKCLVCSIKTDPLSSKVGAVQESQVSESDADVFLEKSLQPTQDPDGMKLSGLLSQ